LILLLVAPVIFSVVLRKSRRYSVAVAIAAALVLLCAVRTEGALRDVLPTLVRACGSSLRSTSTSSIDSRFGPRVLRRKRKKLQRTFTLFCSCWHRKRRVGYRISECSLILRPIATFSPRSRCTIFVDLGPADRRHAYVSESRVCLNCAMPLHSLSFVAINVFVNFTIKLEDVSSLRRARAPPALRARPEVSPLLRLHPGSPCRKPLQTDQILLAQARHLILCSNPPQRNVRHDAVRIAHVYADTNPWRTLDR
jgi:hypothetical protein